MQDGDQLDVYLEQTGGGGVSFAGDVKGHDGLSDVTGSFHEYMKHVFCKIMRPGGETSVSILARKLNVLALATLRKMLVDLITRCQQSPLGRAAILNRGGGSAGSIVAEHIPYLTQHVEYLDTVIGKVRVVIERNKARAAAQQQQQQQQQQEQQQQQQEQQKPQE